MTFAEELLQFAKTVDILNEQLFKNIKEIINDYAAKRWGVKYLKIMSLKFDSDGNRILRKFFLEEYNEDSSFDDIVFVENSDGQMAYVIKHKKPVWIHSVEKRQRLLDAKEYVDSWSDLKDIPQYKSIAENSNIKTSIIIPFYEVEKGKQSLRGVANYEMSNILTFSKADKDELLTLTDTISELLTLYSVRERQESNTNFAITKLKSKLKNFTHFQRENQIFIASPSNGKKDVKSAILTLLENAFPNIQVVDWENNRQTGMISKKLFEDINSSRYGICYFSEWSEEQNEYTDNINVMFEAGLMHSKFTTFNDDSPLWIPIREKNAPDFPFDVQGLNTIVIPREEDGRLKIKAFQELLNEFLVTMMKS